MNDKKRGPAKGYKHSPEHTAKFVETMARKRAMKLNGAGAAVGDAIVYLRHAAILIERERNERKRKALTRRELYTLLALQTLEGR